MHFVSLGSRFLRGQAFRLVVEHPDGDRRQTAPTSLDHCLDALIVAELDIRCSAPAERRDENELFGDPRQWRSPPESADRAQSQTAPEVPALAQTRARNASSGDSPPSYPRAYLAAGRSAAAAFSRSTISAWNGSSFSARFGATAAAKKVRRLQAPQSARHRAGPIPW
jgi:hypothetical protein